MSIRRSTIVPSSQSGAEARRRTAEDRPFRFDRDNGMRFGRAQGAARSPALRRALAGTTALTAAAVCGCLLVSDAIMAAPTGGVAITGFQIRYWPYYEPSNVTSGEITDANAWQHRLTGLSPDTWYAINMRACTNQGGCTSAPWSHDYEFKTLPG